MNAKEIFNARIRLKWVLLLIIIAALIGIILFIKFNKYPFKMDVEEEPIETAKMWIENHKGRGIDLMLRTRSFVIERDSLEKYIREVEEYNQGKKVVYYHVFFARTKENSPRTTTLIIAGVDKMGQHIYDRDSHVLEHCIPCPECIIVNKNETTADDDDTVYVQNNIDNQK